MFERLRDAIIGLEKQAGKIIVARGAFSFKLCRLSEGVDRLLFSTERVCTKGQGAM